MVQSDNATEPYTRPAGEADLQVAEARAADPGRRHDGLEPRDVVLPLLVLVRRRPRGHERE